MDHSDTASLLAAKKTISSAGTWGLGVAAIAGVTTVLSGVQEIWPVIESFEGGSLEVVLAVFTVVTLVFGLVMATFLTQASLALRTATLESQPDVRQLGRGIRKLRGFFKTMGIMFLMAIFAGVIGFIAGSN